MAAEKIKLRPITGEVLDQVVEVHMLAFAGYKNVRLGASYMRAFLRWFCSAPEACTIAAVEGHQIVGYVVGAPTTYSSSLNRSILPVAAKSFILQPRLWIDREIVGQVMTRLRLMVSPNTKTAVPVPPLPAPVYSLVSIAVRPDARGKNVGKELIAAFERIVSERQGKAVRLSVYTDNMGARRLYEKAGWMPYGLSESANWCYYYKVLEGGS